MQFPVSLLILVMAAALIVNAAALVYVALRERDGMRLVEELKDAANKLRARESHAGTAKGGHLDERSIHAAMQRVEHKIEAGMQRVEAGINNRIAGFYGEMERERAEIRRSIEKLGSQLPAAAQKQQAYSAAASGDNPVIVSPPRTPQRRTFAAELAHTYNRFPDDFRSRFNPKAAQLQGKQLVPFDAGSFWVVESPESDFYCLPKARQITPTMHQNVGLKTLFDYDGYDPTGPDKDICVDQPAILGEESASGWTLRERGILRFSDRES